jgi:hypothetical protein
MKWDYAWSIGKLKPDVIVQLWEGDFNSATPYLKDYTVTKMNGISLFVRNKSPMINWTAVKQ